MPPLPLAFPYPLRIGTDICRVARIAHILRSRQGARFIRRVLAPEELARARPAVHQVLRVAAAQQAGEEEERAKGSARQEDEADEAKGGDLDAYARAATYMAGR
ncbi:hypothetical protein MYCTH_2310149 [Thermothelomyces thermophilus ATCC 42464]|uniref:Uncharacterized protein n=1 Tax=Thermothelomyces thermophilus (strain ATCC 42464 / BCRC 31852 / DSM 1799) TaxID=573729 RepID=G2QL45_THET4|nr:uncharacterized protein MYCTH_2310149 [Thermothelomyces thermophilus ATCC 42464]AEO60677.1 hypothetical protein MYCTH_2310149 [Thermothelomyces thermophilus ATCC 42464]